LARGISLPRCESLTNTIEPSTEAIAQFTRLAADLPHTDIVKQLYIIQEQGPHTPGAAVLRRALAEIIALRVMVRKLQRGDAV
jgi:hypothetical protein